MEIVEFEKEITEFNEPIEEINYGKEFFNVGECEKEEVENISFKKRLRKAAILLSGSVAIGAMTLSGQSVFKQSVEENENKVEIVIESNEEQSQMSELIDR